MTIQDTKELREGFAKFYKDHTPDVTDYISDWWLSKTIPITALEKYISEKIDLYSYEDDDNYFGRVEAYQDLLTFIKSHSD